MIEGDGIGPEISQSVKDIFSAANVSQPWRWERLDGGREKDEAKGIQAPVKWEPVDVTPILKDGKTAIPDAAIDSVKRNYVALKGPLAVSRPFETTSSQLN